MDILALSQTMAQPSSVATSRVDATMNLAWQRRVQRNTYRAHGCERRIMLETGWPDGQWPRARNLRSQPPGEKRACQRPRPKIKCLRKSAAVYPRSQSPALAHDRSSRLRRTQSLDLPAFEGPSYAATASDIHSVGVENSAYLITLRVTARRARSLPRSCVGHSSR
jgi:hypothetical protein